MRIIALLATYNEERFIAAHLEHLFAQGVDVHLTDNDSTDRTVEIASAYLGRGLLAIETHKRDGTFNLHAQLERKQDAAMRLDADWFMHLDTDEFRVSPVRGQTLRDAFAEADAAGFNAVNFMEFTFVPTREHPDHDHARFLETMRWYYPFSPRFPNRLNAWKKQAGPVDLVTYGGHRVLFPGLKMFPRPLVMKHYLYLGAEHAIRKYVNMKFNRKMLELGWSGWRATLTPEMIAFPCERDLRTYVSDDAMDASNPRARHLMEESWARHLEKNHG